MHTKIGFGQDSHVFEKTVDKPLILGGVVFENAPGLKARSDGDVVLHALTNAVSSITGVNILGDVADDLCRRGILDSARYLSRACDDLNDWKICHIAISIECRTPKITPKIAAMKMKIAELTGLQPLDVGITATSGENLTAFGKGLGIAASAVITATKK